MGCLSKRQKNFRVINIFLGELSKDFSKQVSDTFVRLSLSSNYREASSIIFLECSSLLIISTKDFILFCSWRIRIKVIFILGKNVVVSQIAKFKFDANNKIIKWKWSIIIIIIIYKYYVNRTKHHERPLYLVMFFFIMCVGRNRKNWESLTVTRNKAGRFPYIKS